MELKKGETKGWFELEFLILEISILATSSKHNFKCINFQVPKGILESDLQTKTLASTTHYRDLTPNEMKHFTNVSLLLLLIWKWSVQNGLRQKIPTTNVFQRRSPNIIGKQVYQYCQILCMANAIWY